MILMEDICKAAGIFYGVPYHRIYGHRGDRRVCVARHVALTLCRDHLNLPLLTIARYFGRDHTTIVASVETAKRSAKTDRIVSNGLGAVPIIAECVAIERRRRAQFMVRQAIARGQLIPAEMRA